MGPLEIAAGRRWEINCVKTGKSISHNGFCRYFFDGNSPFDCPIRPFQAGLDALTETHLIPPPSTFKALVLKAWGKKDSARAIGQI